MVMCGRMVMLAWVAVILACVGADLISYENDLLLPQRPIYLMLPKFGPGDVPAGPPGDGRSFVDMSPVSIELDCDAHPHYTDCIKTVVEVLVFKAPPGKYWMDFWPNREVCCTAAVAADGDCSASNVGRMIIPRDDAIQYNSDLSRIEVLPGDTVHFGDDETSLGSLKIKETGLYIIVMATCDAKAERVLMHGFAESMEPYGYLPADMWGNVYFFSIVSVVYVALSVCWSLLCYSHMDELLPIQLWITAVFGLGMLETCFMYLHYTEWNALGTQLYMVAAIGFLCGVAKRTVSRVLVLIASMGYGVVKPSLGDDWHRVLYLALMYGGLSLVYVFVRVLPDASKSSTRSQKDAIGMVVIALSITDAAFYTWTLQALNKNIATLAQRKQAAKLLLYQRFRYALVVSLLMSTMWILWAASFIVNDPGGHAWELEWSKEGALEVSYLVVLVATAFLWAPTKNSQRYAHSIELTQLDDDELGGHVPSPHDEEDPLDDEYLGGDDDDDDDLFLSARPGPSKKA